MTNRRNHRIIRNVPIIATIVAIVLMSMSSDLREEFVFGPVHLTRYELLRAFLVLAILSDLVLLYLDRRSHGNRDAAQ